jgi:carnitine O-acetyltransferase
MKDAKAGLGVDRHLLGLRQLAREHGMPEPELYQDPSFAASSRWRLSTSNCGGKNAIQFGFGPVVPEGFGIGYVVHNDAATFSITSFTASA